MGFVRTALHLFAKRLARRVAADGLFEKPGEREKTSVLAEGEAKAGRPVEPVDDGVSE